MTSRPPVITPTTSAGKFKDPSIWVPGTGQDPAKYLIFPGTVRAPGKHSPGNLRHARPYIANGSKLYVFPIGVEGFSRTGQATLGLHHYLGDNAVDGTTIHFEEGRITLTGMFPGLTAQDNMVECINMLRSKTKERGLVLYAPGVFEREQFVLPETWDFTHAEDDRTHSISYTVTLVRIDEGKKVKDSPGTSPGPNPVQKRVKPKGKPSRIFTVKAGARTLRQIAKKVYNDDRMWQQLVSLNAGQLAQWQSRDVGTAPFNLPTHRFPIGTKFRY
jgi:hypothetical protein